MRGRRADRAANVLVFALLWAMALVPTYGFWEWPRQIATGTLVEVLTLAGALGIVAASSSIREPVVRLAFVLLGVAVVWCPATAWLTAAAERAAQALGMTRLCPGLCLSCQALLGVGAGRTGLLAGVVFASILLAVPIAIWRRPPGRRPDGEVVRSTWYLRGLAVACIVGGPVLGLVAWLFLVPGDIYGGPLGLGLLVGLFGLLVLTGHAAIHGLVGRPGPAGAIAVAYAATVIFVPVVQAAARGTLRFDDWALGAVLALAVLFAAPLPLVWQHAETTPGPPAGAGSGSVPRVG